MENDKRPQLDLPTIVLASGSPRRSEILNSVGWKFEKQVPDVDESEISGESPEEYVTRLAVTKAETIARNQSGRIVLGADTTVVVDDQILGKPTDKRDANRMILMLSGRVHKVITGVALSLNGRTLSGTNSTEVKFAEMDENEIAFLASAGNPLDKAGGYAVQAEAALFIKGINGDYWNVVGLPISLVYRLYNELID